MKRITTKDCQPDYTLPEADTTDGMAAYIMECHVAGIGQTLSRKIAQQYGKMTIDRLCDPDYKQLSRDIDGIGERKAMALHQAFTERFGPQVEQRRREQEEQRKAATIFWGELKVSPWQRIRIEEHFGDDAAKVLKADPYRLTEIEGIGFKRADEVAERLGITGSDQRRIRAGIRYTLGELAATEGHCCLPQDVLTAKAASEKVLNVDRELVAQTVSEEIEAGRLILDEWVYLPEMYEAEEEVADRLRQMNEDAPLETWGHRIDSKYNDLQRKAISMAADRRLMILTGGPGTGKTTTLKGMLRVFERAGLWCVLCAPTGRAAKRMSEATGRTAKTIHRMLEYNGDKFLRNEDKPIDERVIICDESSMIDLMLMRSLLRAVTPDRHRLIFIGDNDQLPSVGAGRVLGDMIASRQIPTVTLTEIYRQQEGSYIVSNAHNIIHGALPVVQGTTDFFFMPTPTEQDAQQIVADLVSRRLPKAYPGEEIQVLCPMRKDGVLTGCNELNRRLQQALNPWGRPLDIGDRRIRVGDRVMQMKNNYGLGVFNGDVGHCKGDGFRKWKDADGNIHTDRNTPTLDVRYPDRPDLVGYTDENVSQLDLCYATTIHKSQGSEYDTVIIVLMPSAYIMLQRNLLYTAVTRAKRRCIIVGDWHCVETAVSQWKTKPRHTRLAQRLCSE